MRDDEGSEVATLLLADERGGYLVLYREVLYIGRSAALYIRKKSFISKIKRRKFKKEVFFS